MKLFGYSPATRIAFDLTHEIWARNCSSAYSEGVR